MTTTTASTSRVVRAYLWRPASHWLLFFLVLVTLSLALFAQGYARHDVGRTSTLQRGPKVAALASAGPVLDLGGEQIRSATIPDREVALTFDDGPDPTWTPRLLRLLRRQHVPATFFVVGSKVISHPGIVRRELAQGAEIGSHTFTHVDLGNLPAWRQNVELSLTETALAGATGRTTTLLRLPYSSSTQALPIAEYRAADRVAHFGYLLVEATQDTRDWQRPGVGSIVGRGTPPPGQGGIILLHDGGGDRRQTLAGTAQLIARLRASGYRFRTVSQLVGIRSPAGRQRAPLVARLQGLGLLWALRLAFALTGLVGVLLIPIGVLAVARAVVIFVLARRHARTARTQPDRAVTLLGPLSVTAIVPAYNEEVGIERTVRSLLASTEVDIEVVVVDDGSTDRTSEIVGMITDPRLVLVRQANAGKAAALNRGIGRAQHDLIVMMDGDTVFEPGTVAALAGAFADPTVGAVSGNTKVGNRSGLLGRWQHIEYVIGFNLDRRMYDHLRCMPTVPGAVGAFRRSALEAVGGLSLDTLAEDTDVTMAIQRAGWRVVYRQDAVAWTEAPATIDALWRQRYRWSYGTMQAMWKHRGAIRERSRLGRVGLPYLFFFQVLLPLIAPAIDLFALYGVVFLNPVPVAEYWLGFNLISLALAIYAFRLDGERLRPLWALPLQQIVYRQLMYAVVIQSVVSALVGARLHWHTSQRLGVDTRA